MLKQRALCGMGTYLRPDELAILVRDQAVLGEDVIVVGDDCGGENRYQAQFLQLQLQTR